MILRACFFFLLCVVTTQATPPPNVIGASVIVLDANTGSILYQRNANEHRTVGSTQKLLTALIVAEHGDLNHLVTIDRNDELTEPTMLHLRPGDQYTREQLLTALLVKSPNDVARALARDQAGSVENFKAMLNQRAAQLGATSSYFVTPNGLPAPGQYSTALDMAKIALAAYHNSTLRPIVATKFYPFHFANGEVHLLKNTNKTLREYSFCNGMKTGYTTKSKHCLITSGSYQGRDAITVILGTPNRDQLFADSAQLLRWALNAPFTKKMRATKPLPPSSSKRNRSRKRRKRHLYHQS